MKHLKFFALPQLKMSFPVKTRKRLLAVLLIGLITFTFLFASNQPALAQGTLTISGNTGAPWVELLNADTLNPVISDINGNYSFTVPYGWSKTLIPAHKDYTFSPNFRTYSNITIDQVNQNYTPALLGSITAGTLHSCWLKSNGSVVCWGSNVYGEGTPPAGTFRQLSAGMYYTCGIKTDNTITCWGFNNYGESTPPSGTFVQISSGLNHSCGIKGNGTVACWGQNTWGGATPPSGAFKQISAGTYHTCGLKNDKSIACWGWNNDGETNAPSGSFMMVSAGDRNTCAINTDYNLVCWGAGTTNTGVFPEYGQSIPPSGTYRDLSLGHNFGCALDDYGHQVCWGLSITDTTPEDDLVFRQFSSGGAHNCGLKMNGASLTDVTLICWGYNEQGQANPITIEGNAGAGTTLTYTDGIAKTTTTDSSGHYSIAVSYNWSGTITPSNPSGVTFSPASKSYTNLTADPAAFNFGIVQTFTSVGADDGWVLESSETSEVGGSKDNTNNLLHIGDDGLNRQYRTILSFSTAALPDNAVIQSVTLRVRQYSIIGQNNPLNSSHLRIDLAQGPFSTAYALQNGDFEATSSASTIAIIAMNSVPDANNWYSTNFNATGKSLINLLNKTQLRLRFGMDDNNDNMPDYIRFYSADAPGSHPQLIITYTTP